MRVECNFFGPFRGAVGAKTIERDLPEGATVADLAAALADEFDELSEAIVAADGGLADGINVTVDGRNVRQLDGGATPLADGATVRFAPPVVGGRGAGGQSSDATPVPAPGSTWAVTFSSGTVPSGFQPRSS